MKLKIIWKLIRGKLIHFFLSCKACSSLHLMGGRKVWSNGKIPKGTLSTWQSKRNIINQLHFLLECPYIIGKKKPEKRLEKLRNLLSTFLIRIDQCTYLKVVETAWTILSICRKSSSAPKGTEVCNLIRVKFLQGLYLDKLNKYKHF